MVGEPGALVGEPGRVLGEPGVLVDELGVLVEESCTQVEEPGALVEGTLVGKPGATVATGIPEAFAGEPLAWAVEGLYSWLPTVTCSSLAPLSSAVCRAVCRLEYRIGQSGNWTEPCSLRNSFTAALELIGSWK